MSTIGHEIEEIQRQLVYMSSMSALVAQTRIGSRIRFVIEL